MSTYEELTPEIEAAAIARYEERAAENPGLHKEAQQASEEESRIFAESLGEDYFRLRPHIATGIYRLLMDFTDMGNKDVDMVGLQTMVQAYGFLFKIYGGDLDKTVREFALLAVSLELVEMAYKGEMPEFTSSEARFGFLFSLALDTGTATGLQRPGLTHTESEA